MIIIYYRYSKVQRDCIVTTAKENLSILALIQMWWLPTATA